MLCAATANAQLNVGATASPTGTTMLQVTNNGSKSGLSVGYAATPPTDGAIIKGNVGIGTSTISTNALLTVGTAFVNDGAGLTIAPGTGNYAAAFHGITEVFAPGSTGVAYTYWSKDQTAASGYGSINYLDAGLGSSITAMQNYAGTTLNSSISLYGSSTTGAFYLSLTGSSAMPAITARAIGTATFVGINGLPNNTGNYALNVNGNTNSTGTVSAAGVVLTSDARLKENIQPLEDGLAAVEQLSPVSYNKKQTIESTDYSIKNEIGFLAQDVQKVFPNLVVTGTDKDKTMAVNYIALIPVLTKAIQQQQALLKAQDASIKAQDALLKALSAKVAQLEKK